MESINIRVEAASPGLAATAMNNFQGTETVEEASRNIVRAALGENDPSNYFLHRKDRFLGKYAGFGQAIF